MIVLRDKTYSFKPEAYVPVGRRLKDASAFGAIGAILGALGGSMVGAIFGSAKYGALGGAVLSAYLGGKTAWDATSKKNIDKRNQFFKKQYEAAEKLKNQALKDPQKYLTSLYTGSIQDYKKLEKKYDIQFPKDLWNYVELQKKFILSHLVKFLKDNPDCWASLTNIVRPIDQAHYPEMWIQEGLQLNHKGDTSLYEIGLITDPERADDTVVCWYPQAKNKPFGWGPQGGFPVEGTSTSLGKIMMEWVDWDLEDIENPVLIQLAKDWKTELKKL